MNRSAIALGAALAAFLLSGQAEAAGCGKHLQRLPSGLLGPATEAWRECMYSTGAVPRPTKGGRAQRDGQQGGKLRLFQDIAQADVRNEKLMVIGPGHYRSASVLRILYVFRSNPKLVCRMGDPQLVAHTESGGRPIKSVFRMSAKEIIAIRGSGGGDRWDTKWSSELGIRKCSKAEIGDDPFDTLGRPSLMYGNRLNGFDGPPTPSKFRIFGG